MRRRQRQGRALIVAAVVLGCVAWSAAAILWSRNGEREFAISFFLLGVSLGPCLAIYARAARRRKQAARRAVLLTGGSSILTFSLFGRANVDLEGFFMLLLIGSGGAAIGHTLVTALAGPLLFGRVLCGWGCWRSMALEQLRLGKGAARRRGLWKLLPYAGLAVSFAAAATSVRFGEHPGGAPGSMHAGSVRSTAAAVVVYYAASMGLAFALRDKRAFCKYLCPTSAVLRQTSRFAILRMRATREACNGCGACSRVCPMDIDVARFAAEGLRIPTADCIVCQRCAEVCPTEALRFGAGAGT